MTLSKDVSQNDLEIHEDLCLMNSTLMMSFQVMYELMHRCGWGGESLMVGRSWTRWLAVDVESSLSAAAMCILLQDAMQS